MRFLYLVLVLGGEFQEHQRDLWMTHTICPHVLPTLTPVPFSPLEMPLTHSLPSLVKIWTMMHPAKEWGISKGNVANPSQKCKDVRKVQKCVQ